MITPSVKTINENIDVQHHFFPVSMHLDMDHQQWFQLFKWLRKDSPQYHVLLESGRAGRYSMMAIQPTHRLIGKNKQLHITELNDAGESIAEVKQEGDLLPLIRRWMSSRCAPRMKHLPDFVGGLVGFYSYDLVREIEELETSSEDDLETPDVYLLAYDRVIVYDHEQEKHALLLYQQVTKNKVGQIVSLEKDYEQAKALLTEWKEKVEEALTHVASEQTAAQTDAQTQHQSTQHLSVSNNKEAASKHKLLRKSIQPSFSESQFVQAVEKVQAYISAGDVFQVNLSVRQSRPIKTEPIDIYETLRELNPSPYMGYLNLGDLCIVSGSPEQLVKLKGNKLNTRPIAGTRPRGKDRDEDIRLAKELIENEKERAEHVMLVDLERNDLGKVCQYGTVKVNEFMVIEEYSHVMHIVSNVQGVIHPEKDTYDVVEAVFPGGTITGAPKVRTMEIIEELEPVRRGIYTGSIGWIDYNGDMELNIVIRTMLVKDGWAHVQAGAGIVIDSVPVNEYAESLKKAEALWRAFEQTEQQKMTISATTKG